MTVLLMFPNRIDGAVLSGGSWLPALPLANLQNRTLKKVARSSSLATSATQFTIALDRSRSIRALVLVNHNLTSNATVRVTGSDAADFSLLTYDSGWSPAYPAVFDIETLQWEDDSFWSGQASQEDLEGLTQTALSVLAAPAFGRYWRWEISDPTNPAGFVQIGRAFLSGEWQPSHNYSYGASLGVETSTAVATSLGGAEYFDRRDPVRVMRFSLEYLDETEAFARGFDLMRKAGIDREVFVIADPDDGPNIQRRSFLGRLRTLNPLEQAVHELANMSFEIKELL